MALALVQAYAVARYRIRALFVGDDPTGQPPIAFGLSRSDGGPSLARVVATFSPDVGQLELVLSESLVAGLAYQLAWSGATVELTLPAPVASVGDAGAVDDPEAEVFGRDLAWLDGVPTPDGDCPSRRGQDCLVHDLVTLAVLRHGELVHLAGSGVGLPDQVNGPSVDSDLRELAGELEREWLADDRVADASAQVAADSDGSVSFDGRVRTVGLGNVVRVNST